MSGNSAAEDPAWSEEAALEERLRKPTAAALVTVVAALPALVVGLGVALLLPGTEGLLPVDGPVSWAVSVLATAFVAYLANLVPLIAWTGLLAWVRDRRGRAAHDVAAIATCPLPLGVSLGAAVLAGDAGQVAGLGLAATMLAVAAIASGRHV